MQLGSIVVALALGLATVALGSDGSAAPKATTSHSIAFEIGDVELHDGDVITITELSGDRAALEPGGTYRVKGRYKLASQDRGDWLLKKKGWRDQP